MKRLNEMEYKVSDEDVERIVSRAILEIQAKKPKPGTPTGVWVGIGIGIIINVIGFAVSYTRMETRFNEHEKANEISWSTIDGRIRRIESMTDEHSDQIHVLDKNQTLVMEKLNLRKERVRP